MWGKNGKSSGIEGPPCHPHGAISWNRPLGANAMEIHPAACWHQWLETGEAIVPVSNPNWLDRALSPSGTRGSDTESRTSRSPGPFDGGGWPKGVCSSSRTDWAAARMMNARHSLFFFGLGLGLGFSEKRTNLTPGFLFGALAHPSPIPCNQRNTSALGHASIPYPSLRTFEREGVISTWLGTASITGHTGDMGCWPSARQGQYVARIPGTVSRPDGRG
ncbi:hypothetical protein F4861DRAFT_205919 [Xylaria intraflava]|nr:hypothetical protein F4861DRAFT_205919 [Xylaria intraflava]